MIGQTVSHYKILEQIGAGGMGEVFRAHDSRLNRDVAIKVMPASFAADVDRLRRFQVEAQAASALNHPNILVVHDIGTHEGAPYLVTELLEGETLRERLRHGHVSATKAVEYARQTAAGLARRHTRAAPRTGTSSRRIFS
jgi:serine/threonine protein kinase